jgi:hypothetical protein
MELVNDPGQHVWKRWRSSPALLAHVATVIEDAVDLTLRGSEFRIEAWISDSRCEGFDVEAFATPEEFKANVTLEALRHFAFLFVNAKDPTLSIELKLGRVKPGARLKVESKDDPARVGSVVRDVSAAIIRGVPAWYITVMFFFSVAAVTVAAAISANYLINTPSKWAQHIVHDTVLRNILSATPGALYVLLFLFARPIVEVADIGQTRLWRMVRIFGPVVAGVIVSAIAKWLLKGA